jgi:hypothetical protein
MGDSERVTTAPDAGQTERLRHAPITTTLNTYGHLFPTLDEERAGHLDDLAREPGVARLWHERPGMDAGSRSQLGF